MKPCKKHLEWMRIEIKKLKEALETHSEFNNLNNDKDAYLYAVCQWALGVDKDKPVKEDFGL
jgi:hypothetical protein